MSNVARKIPIHVRPPRKKWEDFLREREEHTRKKIHAHASARAHLIEHEKEKLKQAVKHLVRPKPPEKKEVAPEPLVIDPPQILEPEEPILVAPITSPNYTEALVPPRVDVSGEPVKLAIPKKPLVLEGISMNALSIAYFCMEIGIESGIPTYAGGLGILAGDMLASSTDLEMPVIGVTLCYRKGFFKQRFDQSGWQVEEEASWNPYDKLVLLPHDVTVTLEGRAVHVRAWLYKMRGVRGNINPVIFLDTNFASNVEEDRQITDKLYEGDQRHRLRQEVVLGVGGVRMLTKLGATNIQKFHMNEGHAALLTIELYRQYAACDDPLEEVRRRAVFTTHTPVAAGHDRFPEALAKEELGEEYAPPAMGSILDGGGMLNMTQLGLYFSQYTNGVAKKHSEVTRELFPGYRIESITNGVNSNRWTSEPFARLFDQYLPTWRVDPFALRYALSIPGDKLWAAHMENKRRLIEYISERHAVRMDPDSFTIGFARRATAYKRANLLFSDIERLLHIADKSKGIQIIYAGKAHPADRDGKLLIQEIIRNMVKVGYKIKCVYLEDYNIDMAKLLAAGVDLWLNTPVRPQEASGTSGMKAALNGVPQFSVLDGWWLEGHIEGVTGWSIGPHPEVGERQDIDAEDVADLYNKLEHVIIPKYENEREEWVKVMRSAIAINGSFFNTHRMAQQYVLDAYFK